MRPENFKATFHWKLSRSCLAHAMGVLCICVTMPLLMQLMQPTRREQHLYAYNKQAVQRFCRAGTVRPAPPPHWWVQEWDVDVTLMTSSGAMSLQRSMSLQCWCFLLLCWYCAACHASSPVGAVPLTLDHNCMCPCHTVATPPASCASLQEGARLWMWM
eukprot:scaffold12181_cov20-Tisochrysis_lutea.AAC.6